MGTVVEGILLNLAANAAWAVIAWIWSGLRKRERAQRNRRDWVLGVSTAIAGVMIIALVVVVRFPIDAGWGWIVVLSGGVWEAYVVAGELRRFWRVGVVGADISTASGLDYDAALRLVTNELSFLGTGASKLTKSPEFEAALTRCRHDETIRLLLKRPGDDVLSSAEKRAGAPRGAYSDSVVASLRILERLHRSFSNIEVRFYQGEAIFRVMLIDQRLALVSYNVYGHGDGSQLPQLHVTRAADRHTVRESFYHAFSLYFTKVWQEAQPWDFKDHL